MIMRNYSIVLAFCLSLVLTANLVNADIFINEIMPDPDDGCLDCTEWIEIFLDDSPANFAVDAGGKNSTYSLNCSGFFVITENKTAFLHLWDVNETLVIEGEMSLNNDGDCVVLYQNGLIKNSFCYSSSKRNVSWVRCDGGWLETGSATPGYKNACPVDDALSITGWEFFPVTATVNDSVNFSMVLENSGEESLNVSIYLVIGKLDMKIFCSKLELPNATAINANCSWTVPADIFTDDEENFEIYPVAESGGLEKRGEIKIITLRGLQDFGEPYISAEDIAEPVRFGDFAFVRASLYTGNENRPLRILAYIYKPKWASMDLDGNAIHSHLNETNTALLLESFQRGENITLYLPLLIKSSCKGDYPEGVYTGRVRAYIDGDDKVAAEDTFSITLAGNNPVFCMECQKCEKTICNCNTYSSWNAGKNSGNKTANASKNAEEQLIELVSYEENVSADDIFKTVVNIKNIFNTTENFSLYSYVFDGSLCLSLGFDGKLWKTTWDANEKTVEIANGSSIDIALENMIENETSPGVYKFRIRLKYKGKIVDLTRDISVMPASAAKNNSVITNPGEKIISNVTESSINKSGKSGVPATGMITSKNTDIFSFLSVIFRVIFSWMPIFKF